MKESCESCAFNRLLRCHRHAPRPPISAEHWNWPEVLQGDWCGEWLASSDLESELEELQALRTLYATLEAAEAASSAVWSAEEEAALAARGRAYEAVKNLRKRVQSKGVTKE